MLNTQLNQTVPRQFGFNAGNFIPARLDAGLTAKLLGFQEHDIPVLVSRNLLKPLGKPTNSARKYFARVEIMECAENPAWLTKATQIVSLRWHEKNANRKLKTEGDESSHAE